MILLSIGVVNLEDLVVFYSCTRENCPYSVFYRSNHRRRCIEARDEICNIAQSPEVNSKGSSTWCH